MLKDRLIIAVTLIPLVIYTVMAAEMLLFALLMAVFVGIAAWEWANLIGFNRKNSYIYLSVTVLFMVIAYPLSHTILTKVLIVLAIAWWIYGLFLVLLYQNGRNLTPSNRLIRAAIGLLILLPAWQGMVALHERLPGGVNMVLFLLILVWLADTAAYIAGCRWGKTKLISHISPGKTWEGILGAFIACSIMSAAYVLFYNIHGMNIYLFMILCLVTVMFSVLGDLVESLFKRLADKKDSGAILLGHGGVMDRMDSLTAATPVFLAGIWLLEGKL